MNIFKLEERIQERKNKQYEYLLRMEPNRIFQV